MVPRGAEKRRDPLATSFLPSTVDVPVGQAGGDGPAR